MSYTTLVDVATLQAHVDDPAWLIVDVRHQLADTGYGERVYAESHIPGAVFLHCDRDLSGPITGSNGRHPLPDPEKLAKRLGEIGIGAATQVVVYDDAQGMIAGRPDWCISCQRTWGVPIALFVDKQQQSPHPRSVELMEQVAERIEQG